MLAQTHTLVMYPASRSASAGSDNPVDASLPRPRSEHVEEELRGNVLQRQRRPRRSGHILWWTSRHGARYVLLRALQLRVRPSMGIAGAASAVLGATARCSGAVAAAFSTAALDQGASAVAAAAAAPRLLQFREPLELPLDSAEPPRDLLVRMDDGPLEDLQVQGACGRVPPQVRYLALELLEREASPSVPSVPVVQIKRHLAAEECIPHLRQTLVHVGLVYAEILQRPAQLLLLTETGPILHADGGTIDDDASLDGPVEGVHQGSPEVENLVCLLLFVCGVVDDLAEHPDEHVQEGD
mmetsp:Transcript_111501/g.314828  ORF Transcript_111501/g.314828 Transcript_111501/m.314828 type:complete len:298 (+) Transcript_111501:47-940(+)